jgi:hypothetical protein
MFFGIFLEGGEPADWTGDRRLDGKRGHVPQPSSAVEVEGPRLRPMLERMSLKSLPLANR